MNKADLVEIVAKVVPARKDAAAAVNAVIVAIRDSIKKGRSVTLVGLGTFKVVKRKARTGRNPKTGKEIRIEARKVPVFKAGAALKAVVR